MFATQPWAFSSILRAAAVISETAPSCEKVGAELRMSAKVGPGGQHQQSYWSRDSTGFLGMLHVAFIHASMP
jgi:hypothetical protein